MTIRLTDSVGIVFDDLAAAIAFFVELGVELFAMTATLIVTCGIYGLMAYAVTERRCEIGVRMTLGAERRDALRLGLTRALRIIVAGVIVGLAGAAGVTRVLQTFLFGVTPTDPIAFTIVTLLLIGGGTDGGMAVRAPRDKDRPVRRTPARPVKVLDGVIMRAFAVLDAGIYYVDRRGDETRLQFFDFAIGRSAILARNLGNVRTGLSVSRDGRTILYTRQESSVDDLMLVENFR